MGTRMIPSVYVKIKHFSQSYELRKRSIEQLSGLNADEARDKVLVLANNVINKLADLSDKIEHGELDKGAK